MLKIKGDLSSNPTLTKNRTAIETEPEMDDLPELPFEKVLSYLSLGDLIKSRAVSRRWYHKIDSLFTSVRLPEQSAVQSLVIDGELADFRFLFRFLNLIFVWIHTFECSIDVKSIRKVLEDLEFLSMFQFKYNNKRVSIYNPKRFDVWVDRTANDADLDAAIQFIEDPQ